MIYIHNGETRDGEVNGAVSRAHIASASPATLDMSVGSNATHHSALALSGSDSVQPLNWGMLGLTVIIICTAVGNLLVCLAVCWEKRLQNMTNYFLMSLAIADFLVSLLVMPLGMVVEMFGELLVFRD